MLSFLRNISALNLHDDTFLFFSFTIQRSDEHPYTHPLPVRAFLLTVVDGVTYTITGGGEGVIKIWKFDQPTNKFEVCSTLEGHIRDVTCLLLIGNSIICVYHSALYFYLLLTLCMRQ